MTIANGGPAAPATDIILDNAAAGVQDAAGGRTFKGSWCNSIATGAYGTNSLYNCGTAATSYRWTPAITTAGSYDVYIWWTEHVNRSSSVPVTVAFNGGSTTQYFDQKTGGGKWVLHGRYNLAAGKSAFVEVGAADATSSADAVRFVAVTTP